MRPASSSVAHTQSQQLYITFPDEYDIIKQFAHINLIAL